MNDHEGNARELIPVNRLDEIPAFASEAEEAEFWSTHSFGESLLELMRPVPFDDELPTPQPRRQPPQLMVAMSGSRWIVAAGPVDAPSADRPRLRVMEGASWARQVPPAQRRRRLPARRAG